MASAAEFQHLQKAILRQVDPGEAALEAAAGTIIGDYVRTLLERAETSTQPALLMLEAIEHKIPTAARLDDLAAFAKMQFDYYANVLGVAQPELGAYEALGRSLATPNREVLGLQFEFLGGTKLKSDSQFITDAYAQAFRLVPDQAVGDAQIQHFQSQLDYFVSLYKGAGLSDFRANLEARGAAFGQMIGHAALVENGPLDFAAEDTMRWAAEGVSVYGSSIWYPPGFSQEYWGMPFEGTFGSPDGLYNVWLGAGDNKQTLVGGHGDDRFFIWSSGNGDQDVIDLSVGGEDRVNFIVTNEDESHALGGDFEYHHVIGFDVADDVIEINARLYLLDSKDFDTTTNTPITVSTTIEMMSYETYTPRGGIAEPTSFIKFVTSQDSTGDNVEGLFIEAISSGSITVATGTGDVLAAMYDADNQQMILFTVDAASGSNDNLIQADDDISVIATFRMAFADFLAFDGNNLDFVAG